MPSDRSFRERVLAGEILLGTFSILASPAGAELSARSGLDWVLVDLEHGLSTESELLPQLMAIRGAGATPIVRVETGARLRIGRALDMGAEGIMVPQVHRPQEAADVAAALRYQPAGSRGIMLFSRGMSWGAGGHAAVSTRHQAITSMVQIESPEAVANAAAMAAIDGVDVLFVGPADLSHAMGIPGRIDEPAFDAAIRSVADAARAHGKAAGVMLWSPSDVVRYRDAGYTVFSLSNDGSLLDKAVRGFVDETRAAVAS